MQQGLQKSQGQTRPEEEIARSLEVAEIRSFWLLTPAETHLLALAGLWG